MSAWLSSKDSANSIFYCLKLIGSAEITLSELADEDFSNYEWLICSYTDLVRAISRNDNLPFSKENLLQILNHLDKLQRLGWKDLSGDTDKPINLVINSTKGKLIETIIVLSLSICRHVHKSSDDHSNVWSKLTDIYEHLVQEASLEFSALASRYLLQLKYMSSSWLDSHIESILNPKNANAFFFAMDGVAYAPGAPEIFNFLKDTRAIERAITELPYESVARSKLIERIGLAYIWKIESEDSILISQFFDKSHVKDLKFVLDLFWSLSNQQLSPDQMSLILSFWNKSCEFVITNKIDSQEIINVLLKLITYVDEVSSDFYEKYSQLIDLCTNNEAAYFIVKSFDRLHKEFPDKVSSLAANFVDKTGPFYDYESAWLDLTKKILVNQQNKANAFTIMDKLQRERGFRDLYITNI